MRRALGTLPWVDQKSIKTDIATKQVRFSVKDNLCGYSFASTTATGTPTATAAAAAAQVFATGNGVPPTATVNIVNNNSVGGALLRYLIADRPAQHRVARLQRVQDRALRDRPLDFQFHLAPYARQHAQVVR